MVDNLFFYCLTSIHYYSLFGQFQIILRKGSRRDLHLASCLSVYASVNLKGDLHSWTHRKVEMKGIKGFFPSDKDPCGKVAKVKCTRRFCSQLEFDPEQTWSCLSTVDAANAFLLASVICLESTLHVLFSWELKHLKHSVLMRIVRIIILVGR